MHFEMGEIIRFADTTQEKLAQPEPHRPTNNSGRTCAAPIYPDLVVFFLTKEQVCKGNLSTLRLRLSTHYPVAATSRAATVG
jgi:hypothetical protein